MVVGDSFPLEKRRAYVARNLRPWAAICLYCDFIEDPHDKHLVVISASPYLTYFFINTDPYKLAESDPRWKGTQVCIDATNHPFLDYDSFVDCSRVLSLPIYEVERQLVSDLGRVEGVISTGVQAKILEAVKENKVMGRGKKRAVLDSLLRRAPQRGGKT